MCKNKKIANAAKLVNKTASKSGANVTVSVNVTNIVKYISIAGVAIIGIIFGCKSFNTYISNKEDEEE